MPKGLRLEVSGWKLILDAPMNFWPRYEIIVRETFEASRREVLGEVLSSLLPYGFCF